MRNPWQMFASWGSRQARIAQITVAPTPRTVSTPKLKIAPDDPIITYFQNASGAVDIDGLDLDSPTLHTMRSEGVKMVVPLVSQGELIGLLNLGSRLSQQEYSTEDRTLLNNLAAQTAPAVRVAQLVRHQRVEAQEREHIEQEMRIARLIQHTLLPRSVPELDGWQIGTYYQPARAVGGDFYDFLYLPDGRLGLVIGDVTDKGVPAAMVMATTRTVLRAAAQRTDSPGEVLERANEVLCPDIPPNMFITCLYAILDPNSGRLVYANAGHDLPYRRHADGVEELRATGMPLGLVTGMSYEEKETVIRPGDSVLFYSDGLVEAHNPQRELFSFPRLRELLVHHPAGESRALVEFLLDELTQFTGADWEQEDDITLMTIHRSEANMTATSHISASQPDSDGQEDGWRTLADFSLASEAGNERPAMKRVAEAVEGLALPPERLDRLKTAVAEATMNAMEHGNKYQPEVPVAIQVLASQAALLVRITDRGSGPISPDPEAPNLASKLSGTQSPRGRGLFLIENMVDEMRVSGDESSHTIELVLNLNQKVKHEE